MTCQSSYEKDDARTWALGKVFLNKTIYNSFITHYYIELHPTKYEKLHPSKNNIL
jgi:hypothetical protein